MRWKRWARRSILATALAGAGAAVCLTADDAGAVDTPEAPTPEQMFDELNRFVVLEGARLIVLETKTPVLRSTVSRRTVEVSRGFLTAFAEPELQVAGLAHELSHLQLMVRGAPGTENTEALADEEATFLLARSGRDPASLLNLLRELGKRLPKTSGLARSAAKRAAHVETFLGGVDEMRRRFQRARLAMTFGQYEVSRSLLEPLVKQLPFNPEVHTNLGLAWMGQYYHDYGMARPTYRAVQGLLYDPGSAARADLRIQEVKAALARGFSVAPDLPISGERGGKEVPTALMNGLRALTIAHKQLPNEPRGIVNLFLAEMEVASWDPAAAPELARRKKDLQRGSVSWDAEHAALAWLNLGVYHYVVGDSDKDRAQNVELALQAFEQAEKKGTVLGTYNRGLVLALDPDLASRRAEGEALLQTFKDHPSMATTTLRAKAGALSDDNPWPLGGGYIELRTHSPEVAEVVALIEGTDDGAIRDEVKRTELGGFTEVAFPNGTHALIQKDVGAWLVIPPEVGLRAAQDRAVQLEASALQPAPTLAYDRSTAQVVRLRKQSACLDGGSLSPAQRSSGDGCPTVVEIRLPEKR